MDDSVRSDDPSITLRSRETGNEYSFTTKSIRGRKITKLGNIAQAKQGLIPPSARDYYRISSGIRGGAVEGGYIEVDTNLTLSVDETGALSEDQKRDGITINDPQHEKYYVPLDKTGAADIEGRILSQYYRPIEFYVNWSKSAVNEMRVNKQGRFQNSAFYFRKGISYSDTGIYSPTFRLSHGAVFDQKASLIFCDYLSSEFLLGLLCSKLIKYFVKVFINHSVSAQVNSIKEIPIVIPSEQEIQNLEVKVNEIISDQKRDAAYDHYTKQQEIDAMVYQYYNLDDAEINEVEDWYDRRYPKLRRDRGAVQIDTITDE